MVVICLVLLCAAGGLLLTGIVRDSDLMVGSSIGLSVLVAVLLLAGLRGKSTGDAAEPASGASGDTSGRGRPDESPTQLLAGRTERIPASSGARGQASARPLTAEPGRRDEATEVLASADETVVTGSRSERRTDRIGDRPDDDVAGDLDRADDLDDDDEDDDFPDPPDEPGIEPVLAGERERVAGLDVEVAVVDGRPRYHLTDCAHLDGKDAEPLLASEAVELGFTPCARCRPVRELLSEGVGGPRTGGTS